MRSGAPVCTSIFRPIFLAFTILMTTASFAQSSMFTSWLQAGHADLTLITDWDTLWTLKDKSYQDATLLVGDETWKVELRLRGRYRMKYCDILPFQLKFKKKHLEKAGFENFNKIKVVTNCIDNSNEGEENLNEEKLIYLLYQLFTEESFRVVDATITYAYPDDSKPSFTRSALLLEPSNEISSRLGGEEVEDKYNIAADSLDATNYNRIAMFQFMIGNNDWDYSVLRNVKMINTSDPTYLLVPYDFDFSAIVHPSYARLNGDYPVKDFHDRIYLGNIHYQALPDIIQEYLDKEVEVLEFVAGYEELKKSRRREIQTYLKKFFRYLKKEESVFKRGAILYFR